MCDMPSKFSLCSLINAHRPPLGGKFAQLSVGVAQIKRKLKANSANRLTPPSLYRGHFLRHHDLLYSFSFYFKTSASNIQALHVRLDGSNRSVVLLNPSGWLATQNWYVVDRNSLADTRTDGQYPNYFYWNLCSPQDGKLCNIFICQFPN